MWYPSAALYSEENPVANLFNSLCFNLKKNCSNLLETVFNYLIIINLILKGNLL